ncbi:MAG TPA: class I SAM-dependent methyltransferase [Thermomicrobiales bacterium]|nr:class I SAM-dependent methyltransferase [Thermomicrobiales bacterium]
MGTPTARHDKTTRFASWQSIFAATYQDKLAGRFPTMKAALNLFLQHDGTTIVETGTLRWVESLEHGWEGDGNATYIFGEVLQEFGGHLWTCDADPVAIAESREGTKRFADHITYVNQDSVAFLDSFDHPIDLLYLDSMDCPREGDASAAQAHNLRELQAALPKLSRNGVTLIDDNGYPNGGKALKSKQHLAEQGWLCLYDAQQTLWMRRC